MTNIRLSIHFFLSPLRNNSPTRVRASSFLMFLDHTQSHTTVGSTPLDERSARRRDIYLTTQNKKETSMPKAGLETAIPASEWPQTFGLDRPAIGIGVSIRTTLNKFKKLRYCTFHNDELTLPRAVIVNRLSIALLRFVELGSLPLANQSNYSQPVILCYS